MRGLKNAAESGDWSRGGLALEDHGAITFIAGVVAGQVEDVFRNNIEMLMTEDLDLNEFGALFGVVQAAVIGGLGVFLEAGKVPVVTQTGPFDLNCEMIAFKGRLVMEAALGTIGQAIPRVAANGFR